MPRVKIGARSVGEGEPLYFVADIAANHDGDLGRALRLIELAKEAGADAAKFQNFKAAKIVSRHGFETLGGQMSHQKNWKKPVFEVYEDASVSPDWTPALKKKCDEVGIDYFTSPYDEESVDAVDPYVSVYKVGSGDITWPGIIEYIARKNKPVMLAAGASTMEDVDRAMAVLSCHCREIVLMQCNTNYTASPENFAFINLRVLNAFQKRYPEAVLGLSDHTPGCATVVAAVALGAVVFEKHFTDDNSRVGPDHKFAMNPRSWREMVDRANEAYRALGDGKKRVEPNESDTVVVQRRSLRLTRDLAAGSVITADDVFPLRPCPADGIAPYDSPLVLGKRLKCAKRADEHLKWEDIG